MAKPRVQVLRLAMVVLIVLAGQLVACSRIQSTQLGQESFRKYLALEMPEVLIYRATLSIRSPQRVFGTKDQGPELSASAGIGNPLQPFAENFILSASLPDTTSIVEVKPDTLAGLQSLDPDVPVLFFFSGGWYLDYQRFPPDLQSYRLSFSIIGKLVPRGLVVTGGGTLSLPKASWVASCYHVGSRYSLQKWQENNGVILQNEMRKGLAICQDELALNFKRSQIKRQF